jgi:hypothetical protein
MFIGDVRRALFLPWPCAWNSIVREVTAIMEEKGWLQSTPGSRPVPILHRRDHPDWW